MRKGRFCLVASLFSLAFVYKITKDAQTIFIAVDNGLE
jgi:hypothetical protein